MGIGARRSQRRQAERIEEKMSGWPGLDAARVMAGQEGRRGMGDRK